MWVGLNKAHRMSEGWQFGASPDGQYLVLCEARAHPETQYVLRTLLYDVAHDHWHVLSTGVTCGQVLGWEAEAE